MAFEFDPAKSAANLAKHGIDFVQAQEIWSNDDHFEFNSSVSKGEPRFQVLGRIEETIWAAAITYREGRIRIISVRRARRDERATYLSRRAERGRI